MNRTNIFGMAAALVLTVVPALAQIAQSPPSAQTAPAATPSRPIAPDALSASPTVVAPQPSALGVFGKMQASQLIGRSIYDTAGENMAKISDIVINKYDNSAAVLVGVGGLLGIGERQIAVRLSDLDMQGDRIVARNLTMSDLRRLSYQANNWIKHDRESLIGEKVVR